jgi:hypothetical protein
MQDAAAFRKQADRWFRFAKITPDARLKARALSFGRDCLAAAEARETEDAAAAHGLQGVLGISRLSPLRRAALAQIARLDQNIEAIEAEAPRDGSARANVLGSLRDCRKTLLESCGLEPANDPGERS